jgi:indolepyruvate ferredoxin oxidoreductase beta subunit
MSAPTRPVTVLIAALGGEGGGVLTGWIISAAADCGFFAQSTSIPGVAQRTGATTYYIEIVPVCRSELAGRQPVLALTPGIGDIDVVVASELMEASRAVASGLVTPDRTLVVASTSRFYTVNEKIAMGDGRYNSDRLIQAIGGHAQASLLFDMEALAKDSGTIISAVMLGAIAGCGRVPIPPEAFEAAIRADGKSVEGNLRGFRAGLEAARKGSASRPSVDGKRISPTVTNIKAFEREIAARMPAAARATINEGVRRLAAYQDLAYARLYLDRLATIRDADARAGADGRLLTEAARQLAVRMSYEDVIRVAQAKVDSTRLRRIAEDMNVKPGEPYAVVEFLKPGIEELCSILPPLLARPILRQAERRGWRGHVGMEIKSTSVSGYLRFRLLAGLRRWRPRTHRYAQEQAAIKSWLGLIVEAGKVSRDLAIEIAECARLIKGYGDTLKRGNANYGMIEAHVIRLVLDGRIPLRTGIDAIASARTAALVDPEGESLAGCLADLERQTTFAVAAE